MSGGGKETTSTNEPPSWALPHLQTIGTNAQDTYLNNPTGAYPNQSWLPFNQFQQSGINQQLGNVSDLSNLGDMAQYGYGNLMNASNPYSQLNQNYSNALGQNLYGNIGSSLGQMNRGFDYQSQDLGYGLNNLIGSQGRAYDQASGLAGADLANAFGAMGRNYGYQSGVLGQDLANTIGQQSRAYDQSSGRALEDALAFRERQMRDYNASSNQINEDLTKTLPGLSADAALAGQSGSTRQGIAEGLAMQNAQNRLAELGRTQDETLASNLRSAGLDLGTLSRAQSENLGNQSLDAGRLMGNLSREQSAQMGNLGMDYGRGLSDLARSQSENLGQSMTGGIMGMNQLAREQAGQYGDVTQNLTNQANQDMARFMTDQYGMGLDATKAGLLAGPQVAGMTQMPYQSLYQVGDMIRNQEMLPLQQSMSDYYYNQQAPWDALQNYSSMITGMPFGSQTTTEGSSSSLGSSLGLAGMGGSLGGLSGLGGTIGTGAAAFNPYTAAAAMAAGLFLN